MFKHHHPGRPAHPGRLAALAIGALLCLLLPAAGERNAHASAVSGELLVSLTIRDVCTMDTDSAPPEVACSADAPFRIYRDGNFASSGSATADPLFTATNSNDSMEIAF